MSSIAADSVSLNSSVDSANISSFYSDKLIESFAYDNTPYAQITFIENDSVQQLQAPHLTNSLFANHQLQNDRFYPRTHFSPNPDWFTAIIIGVILAITALRTFYPRVLTQLIRAFFNNTVANQIVRDENILVQRASVTLTIVAYFILASLLYKITEFYNYSNVYIGEGIIRFLILALFVSLAYSLKMISMKILGHILKIDKPVATYIFNLFLINNMLGLILTPMLIIGAYVDSPVVHYIFIASIVITAIAILYRWFKGIVIGFSIPNVSVIYIFLYLCALEIAPLLVTIKVATL